MKVFKIDAPCNSPYYPKCIHNTNTVLATRDIWGEHPYLDSYLTLVNER